MFGLSRSIRTTRKSLRIILATELQCSLSLLRFIYEFNTFNHEGIIPWIIEKEAIKLYIYIYHEIGIFVIREQ